MIGNIRNEFRDTQASRAVFQPNMILPPMILHCRFSRLLPLLSSFFVFCGQGDFGLSLVSCGRIIATMPDKPQLSKAARVALILAALRDAPPAASRGEALALRDRVFRLVEDEHCGVPHEPFHADRLYPPVAAMERLVEGKPLLWRYRHTGHYTLIADNGAIVIRGFVRGMKDGVMAIIGERTELDKPGVDGRRVIELE